MAHVAIDCRQHGLMVSSSIPKSAMGKERQTPDAGRERRPEACSIPPAEDGSPRQATCAFPVPLSIEGVRIPRRLASSHGPLPEPTARLRSTKQQERRGWALSGPDEVWDADVTQAVRQLRPKRTMR